MKRAEFCTQLEPVVEFSDSATVINNRMFRIRQASIQELPIIMAIDDDADSLYATHHIVFDFTEDHPFVLNECKRWRHAIEIGKAFVAVDKDGLLLGFIILAELEQGDYIDQLTVHPDYMRRGIGSALLAHGLSECNSERVWLTTYSHLPWNKPYYETMGFRQVNGSECSEEIQEILRNQKIWLPQPKYRIAMLNDRQVIEG